MEKSFIGRVEKKSISVSDILSSHLRFQRNREYVGENIYITKESLAGYIKKEDERDKEQQNDSEGEGDDKEGQ